MVSMNHRRASLLIDPFRLFVFARRNVTRDAQRAFPVSWLDVELPFTLLNHPFGAIHS
jgi:hypothetical protein